MGNGQREMLSCDRERRNNETTASMTVCGKEYKGQPMKLFHLSDLHLGKRVNGFSMIDDQKYILGQIMDRVDEEKPDGVIIAGDVYDKAIPPVEAVSLFDDFLYQLSVRKLSVFLISGNHDSAERLAFGGRLMEASNIYVSPAFTGIVEPIELKDKKTTLHIYLLPFVKPALVRHFFGIEEPLTYTEAIRVCIEKMKLDRAAVNILVAHQFVTGAVRSDSGEVSVGGMDNVDAEVFEPFDYVALGHLHGPQKVEKEHIRYCGSPLKYSFSERTQVKSLTVLEIESKDSIVLRTIPLIAKHDMRQIRGTYEEITRRDFIAERFKEDYIEAVLTDEEDVPDAARKLSIFYPNLMKISYDNTRTRSDREIVVTDGEKPKSEIDLLDDLYTIQNGQPMSSEQRAFALRLFERIQEELA